MIGYVKNVKLTTSQIELSVLNAMQIKKGVQKIKINNLVKYNRNQVYFLVTYFITKKIIFFQYKGDWVCENCKTLNFANKTSCFKCKIKKPDVIAAPDDAI